MNVEPIASGTSGSRPWSRRGLRRLRQPEPQRVDPVRRGRFDPDLRREGHALLGLEAILAVVRAPRLGLDRAYDGARLGVKLLEDGRQLGDGDLGQELGVEERVGHRRRGGEERGDLPNAGSQRTGVGLGGRR